MTTWYNISVKVRIRPMQKGSFIMTKKELVDVVAAEAEITKKAAKIAIDSFLAAVEGSLVKGEEVSLAGFGTFKVKTRAERNGVNPQTKAAVVIPATKVPTFKPSKALKDKVAK